MKLVWPFVLAAAFEVLFPRTSGAQSVVYDFVIIAGYAGQGAEDGTNGVAWFNQPLGVALDAGGNLYVADKQNHTIRRLSPVGTNWVSSTIAGLAGHPGATDGTNSDARFNNPAGVAVDSSTNVYVADTLNCTIRKLTPVGTNWASSTVAGLVMTPGRQDGANYTALFNFPAGIAVDGSGKVYVADTGSSSIRTLTQVGTDWVSGTIAGVAQGVSSPQSLAVSGSGNIYVASGSAILLLQLSGANWVASAIAGLAGSPGNADGTNGSARFSYPDSVALDSRGFLYVADSGNYTIRKLTPVGTNWVTTTIAGLAGAFGSTDGTNSSARFGNYAGGGPTGLTVGNGTNVYVADYANSTIRQVAPSGSNWVTTTIAGRASSSGWADGGGTSASFNGPSGLAFDSATNLYVADAFNSTIRELKRVGGAWVTTTIAGLAGVAGDTDGTNNVALFNTPFGLAVDSGTNLYVADNLNYTVRRLTPVGTNWVSSTLAGLPGVPGSTDGTGSTARFGALADVAVDSHTNLYVTDYYNYVIRKLTPVGTNWVTSTIAGLAGTSGSADGTNHDARFGSPGALVVDSRTNLYVVDSGNFTIRKVTALGTNWVTTTIAGQAGITGSSDGTNTDATFTNPLFIALDGSGNLYVADSGPATIRKISPVGANWVTTTIIRNYSAPSLGADGIAFDSAGDIFVTDSGANTINEAVPMSVTRLPPVFLSLLQANGVVTLKWSSVAGLSYQLQFSPDLRATIWTLLGGPMNASGPTSSAVYPVSAETRFYRVALLP